MFTHRFEALPRACQRWGRAGALTGRVGAAEGPPPVPDVSATLARFQRMLDHYVDDEADTPVDNSRVEELIVPLRSTRAEAARNLLGD